MTSPTQQFMNGHCPNCGPNRNAAVVGFHEVSWTDSETGDSGSHEYRILKCQGCESVYFQEASYSTAEMEPGFSEEIADAYTPTMHVSYWPKPVLRPAPKWTDHLHDLVLRRLVKEMYAAGSPPRLEARA
jgi:hypothetical protein